MLWDAALKLFLAMLLGGIVGMEREIVNRPAGFRTHTLVCMGSTLVMITSQYIFENYSGMTNLDPARLGAQVISGIGFLGAGTILKDGSRVRGLTTAASLWVVACVGLAIGSGFYAGAITTTVLAYITLILFKKVEGIFVKNSSIHKIVLDIRNVPGQIAKVTELMGNMGANIRNIKIISDDDLWVQAEFHVKLPPETKKETLIMELKRLEGIIVDDES